ncbi:LOW QUALITY PROTEIN: carbonic anhydrase-related protein 10-like [Amphiura filiformis]|uniref:LOW QUALITY PROTEIN: carbonic anhydrase-related protein 10-like n=1 Tax=Amphiura filiformis TaxID=82378 RepID=UPI003B2192A5
MQFRTLSSLQLVPAGMTTYLPILLTILLQLLHSCSGAADDQTGQRSERSWQDVWTYDGLQAPEYWGNLHSAWKLCGTGKRQSPIDLQADKLLYDPELDRFEMDSGTVSGTINNTGRGVTFHVQSGKDIIVSEGPLSYKYALYSINLHFGPMADVTFDGDVPKITGSEHTVDGKAYPAEIQLQFYNTELYGHMGGYDKAVESPNGLAMIGIFVMIGNETSRELNKLTSLENLQSLVYKGSSVNVSNLNVKRLLPETTDYVTYEGSLTTPGCHETVSWILMNKPLYITSYQLDSLRELLRTERARPARVIGKNYRPTQELRYRTIRTNIERKETSITDSTKKCPQYKRQYKYKVNRLPRRL